MLPDTANLAVFLVATLTLNFTPGQDMMYVIANSIGGGQRAGVVSALGIGGGSIVHTLAAALGLSALLMSSSVAYDAIRYAGAAYLLYLGIKALTGKADAIDARQRAPEDLDKVFRRGVATNVLNPKVALFFLAFLPQFVDPSRGAIFWQFILLGTLFNISGTVVNTGVALASGYLGDRLGRSGGFSRIQRWFSGSVFLALGARVALGPG